MRTYARTTDVLLFDRAQKLPPTMMTMMCRRNGRLLAALSLLLVHESVSFSSVVSYRQIRTSFITAATVEEETSDATTLHTERILQTVEQEHDEEVANGFRTWGRSTDSTVPDEKEWTDADFVARSVGLGNGGPHEFTLERGDEIFQTLQSVLTVEECQALITEAREVIAKGLKEEGTFKDETGDGGRHQPTNSQLGEARVSQMPHAREWLRQALHERFFPLLESRFGVAAKELTLNDALIIGYGYFGQTSRSQPVHRDSDLLSLNVALSTQDSFDPNGGGTYFDALPAELSVIKTDQGHVLCHSGGAQHAGRGIASGERWVLVLFCVAENEPQLARRCHAKGIIERQEGKIDAAEATFRAGLTVAPNDHLLLSSLGGVFMAKGQERRARNYLSASASSYQHCQKANLGLGRMMLAGGRPRAALRRFDAVLDYLNDCDLRSDAWMPLKAMGWDARVYGSHAALSCVQAAMNLGAEFDSSMYLSRAIERLNVALSAVPGDERILGMLEHAKQMLSAQDDSS